MIAKPKKENISFPVILIITSLFIITRAFFIFLVREDWLFFDRIDELYRGVIAKEFLDGPSHSFFAYAADNYGGGSLVVGTVTYVFFKLLGTNVLALKLTPLLFSYGTCLLWYLALHRINARIAFLFSLLFIFAPFSFVQYSFAALGDHNESMFFTSLGIFTFIKMGYSPHRIYAFLMGVISGFSLWFNYNYGITLAAIIIYWFIMNRKFMFSSFFLASLVGVVVGFTPWILYNLETDFSGLFLYDNLLIHHFDLNNLVGTFSDFRDFVGYQILRAFQDPAVHPPAPKWTFYGYSALTVFTLFLAAIFLITPQETPGQPLEPKKIRPPRHAVALSLIYLLIFSVVVQLSHYKKIHLMTIAHPFLFVLIAYALDRLWVKSKSLTTLILSGFIFLASTSSIYSMSIEVNRLLLMKGYSYHGFSDGFDLSYFHPCRELEKCLRYYSMIEKRLNAEDMETYTQGLITRIEDIVFDEDTPEHQKAMKRKLAALETISPALFKPHLTRIKQSFQSSAANQ